MSVAPFFYPYNTVFAALVNDYHVKPKGMSLFLLEYKVCKRRSSPLYGIDGMCYTVLARER